MESRRVSDSFSCRRKPSETAVTSRDVVVMYTDMFLDTFNYERDLLVLRRSVIDVDSHPNRRTLLVLSHSVYDTIRLNENTDVLFEGRCYIVTPASFGHRVIESAASRDVFEKLVFFNVDPFAAAVSSATPPDPVPSAVFATLAAGVGTPFATAFDQYMIDPSTVVSTDVTIACNTFLLRTEDVSSYETDRGIRVNFNAHVLPIHNFDRDTILRTTYNFCTDAVLSVYTRFHTYVVGADKPIPSHRTLGLVVAQTLSRPDCLALLEVRARGGGGSSQVAEYYRFKQFYFSLAHGRENKWGVRFADEHSFRPYIRFCNTMLREEITRWHWVLSRNEAVGRRPSDITQQSLLYFYTMCPCFLNGPERCDLGDLRSTTSDDTRDRCMARFDTSTFGIGSETYDREFSISLHANAVSLSDTMVVTNARPFTSVHLKHSWYLGAMLAQSIP